MSNNSNQNQNAIEKYNFCNTQLKTTTEKFIWTIEKFSELQEKCGESLASTEFISTAPNGQVLKWQMKIYPNGSKEEFKDCVSLFLYLIDSNNEEVKAKYQFSLRKSSGIECERFSVRECLKFGGTGHNAWGVNELIKRKILFDEKYGLLNGDRFTVVCTLTVHQRSIEKAPLPDVEVPECRVPEDLTYLFEHSLFPDCKITSEDNREFKAHKCILGCRSQVFAAMFEHEMIERNSNEVNIVDIKGDVIEKMLRFIYSGKEPDFGNNPKMAAYLLKAAEKYELIRLKLLCERKLINSLGNVNVCALLILANAYLAQNLKTHAINYVKMNLNEVKKTQGWKLLLADEQLMDEIMTAMAN